MPYQSERDSRSELERLMEQYGSGLLRMCALYLKDTELAKDAVQDAFLKAYRHLGDYRGEGSEKAWLTSICINVCRDMLRTAWFRHQTGMDIHTLPETAVEFSFPDDTVLAEVLRLPQKYREVVLIRYYEQLKLNEIATVLGLSLGKVRSRLNRANEILRSRLKEWYDNEES
mgnify:FL=1